MYAGHANVTLGRGLGHASMTRYEWQIGTTYSMHGTVCTSPLAWLHHFPTASRHSYLDQFAPVSIFFVAANAPLPALPVL
jgi:hypothetical protein